MTNVTMKSTQNHYRKTILLLVLVVGFVGVIALLATGQLSFIKDHKFKDDTFSGDTFNDDVLKDHSKNINPQSNPSQDADQRQTDVELIEPTIVEVPEKELTFQDHLAIQTELRLQSDVRYDGSYRKIAYPMGDVPENIGVCTDVVIRSFRGLGLDLQQRVHEDMKRNFRSYPNKWKLSRPDTNIDHRRVPNLMTYFNRAGASLKIKDDPMDYIAGDIVVWDLNAVKGKSRSKVLLHIGIVSNYVSELTSNPLIVHNIGAGPQMNDMLFDFKIIGHYKYGDKKIAQK
ncbi:DUF1287 domain-containing protein [Cocleimonas flava]|uniref:DUF1287 domain-containing protein n=1 Tax=Cocleimonas flava TaxID=634765 RepID=UPI001A9EB632|nr:DUF1287 domain-containing protein [Cocleimonas flava]